MRIIFMGTPAFAIPSLDILINAGHEIVAVITSTDKLGGRGKNKLIESDIKKYALSKNLKILQPKNLKAASFIEELKTLKAELQVVVAFRMLPEVVWNMPSEGTINLHGSLLPKYRGAAPINWAVMNGDNVTGVSSFKLKHEIDTGNIILQEKLEIKESDTAGTVHDRMMYLGASVIAKTVALIESSNYETISQNHLEATPAPKLYKENTEIDFTKKAVELCNFVRGLNPFPGAWTNVIDGKTTKIYWAQPVLEAHNYKCGEIISDNKTELKIAVSDGYISIKTLQMSGKRKMEVGDFLNGFKLEKR